MTEEEIIALKTCTKMFMNHVHWAQQSFNLIPDKHHIGTCINYVDLQEYREDFCRELVNTIPEWIYSQKKGVKVLTSFISEGRTLMNAQSALTSSTFNKFKNRSNGLFLQGQFGELILFNFLQHFFSAVPLLRKMPITTSAGMERFGADALHYAIKEDKNLFYLGEAKTYTSQYKFAEAFKIAIESILNTYSKHREELGLYIYDDFIDEDLQEIARSYKNGTLLNVEVHLVSVIAYCETKTLSKQNEKQIKEDIIKIIEERSVNLDKTIFNSIGDALHTRFNYIILPVWQLDNLITEFQKLLGK